MKKLISLFVVLLVVPLSLNAQAPTITEDHPKYEMAVNNLLVGLRSDNLGLKVSSAYYLGEMKSDRAVNDLMKVLREDDSEGARISAALALIKIGNERGLYMVKSQIKFNDSERVNRMCNILFNANISGDKILQAQNSQLLISFLDNN